MTFYVSIQNIAIPQKRSLDLFHFACQKLFWTLWTFWVNSLQAECFGELKVFGPEFFSVEDLSTTVPTCPFC